MTSFQYNIPIYYIILRCFILKLKTIAYNFIIYIIQYTFIHIILNSISFYVAFAILFIFYLLKLNINIILDLDNKRNYMTCAKNKTFNR